MSQDMYVFIVYLVVVVVLVAIVRAFKLEDDSDKGKAILIILMWPLFAVVIVVLASIVLPPAIVMWIGQKIL